MSLEGVGPFLKHFSKETKRLLIEGGRVGGGGQAGEIVVCHETIFHNMSYRINM